MGRKKKQKDADIEQNSNVTDPNAASTVEPEGSDKPAEEQQPEGEQKDELAALRDEISALNDKYLRLYSEFDNYRKRTLRERAELVSTATSGLIAQLLPVLDDFDRALNAFSVSTDTEALKSGVLLIFDKFKKTLEQKGLEPIEAMGKPFDTDLHEAITNLPAVDDSQKGHVIEEIEKGYMLNGKVIRFAKVAVAN